MPSINYQQLIIIDMNISLLHQHWFSSISTKLWWLPSKNMNLTFLRWWRALELPATSVFFFTVLIIFNPAAGQDFLPGAEPCEKSRLPRVGSQGSAAAAGAAARGSPGMLWPSDVWNRFYIYIYDISDISLKIDGLHGLSSDSLGSAT